MSTPRAPLAGKVIRVGVVQNGKIILERRLDPGEALTVGASPKAVVSVPDPRLPRRHPLVVPRGGGHQLQLLPNLAGKVSLGGRLLSLEEARQGARGGRVLLGARDRGSLKVGDFTVLFQFVDAPPTSLRELARPSFRPRLLDDDDPVFMGFLGLFTILAGSFAAYTASVPTPALVSIDDQVALFAHITLPPAPAPEIAPEVVPEPLVDPGRTRRVEAPEPEVAAAGSREPERPMTAEERLLRDAQRSADLERSVREGSLLIKVLAGTGESSGGWTLPGGAWDGTEVDIDFDAADARDRTVFTQLGWHAGDGRALDHADKDIQLTTAQGGRSDVTGVGSTRVTGTMRADHIKTPEGRPDAARVRAAIQGYQGRIKACYERRLKEVPNLAGRVEVAWVVDHGRALEVEILSNSSDDLELESCIADSVSHWTFDVDIADFPVSFPFVLAPG
ncbi:MAG: AgmX/PglI C-terminal domain-containing protein [Pseudomonadota bacterium]